MIPFIQNENDSSLYIFEEILKDVISPEEAYIILKQKCEINQNKKLNIT